ncbi:MAG: hypothetical protein FWG99_04300 [Treponema sp.]|nr:hypothetical protein [Treponema sp.]
MRVADKYNLGQAMVFLSIIAIFLCACNGKKEDNPVVPPVTSPLSKDYIGYGVITSSFTHVLAEPTEDSASLGYLRRGTLVRVLRRRIVNNAGGMRSWVLTDTEHNGWLTEDVMDIYDNESRARTAAQSMNR